MVHAFGRVSPYTFDLKVFHYNTYYYTLFILQISFEYLWDNMVKLTNITLPDKMNLFILA